MSLPHRAGIKARVVGAAALVVAVTLTTSCLLVTSVLESSLIAGLDAAHHSRALEVAAQAPVAVQSGVIPSTIEDSAIQLIAQDGSVVASTSNIDGEPAFLQHSPADRRSVATTLAQFPVESGGAYRVTAEPVTLATGPGWVYVASSLSQKDAAIGQLSILFLIWIPVIVVVVALIAAAAVSPSLRPVDRITKRAEEIEATDPAQRVPVPGGHDEIARLAVTMNEMLDRLDASARRQQQFVGDASHELRSPLAAMRTQVDVAMRHPYSHRSGDTLRKVSGQIDRMGMLIDDLLFLARTSERSSPAQKGEVDLDELVIAEAVRLKELGTIRVNVTVASAVRVAGSERDLARMIRNLGDNAYEHARTSIDLSLEVTADFARIAVTDDGPGIDPQDRERIFLRFARVDESRMRTTLGGGSGLGLAIARQIASAGGGTLRAVDRPDGKSGALLIAELPVR